MKKTIYSLKQGEITYNFYEYEYTDEQMPYSRWVSAQVFEKQLSFGLTPDQFTATLEQIKTIAVSDSKSDDKLKEIVQLSNWLQFKNSYNFNEDILFGIASVFFFMDDEPEEFSLEWAKKKRELWNSNPEAKLFFCEQGYRKIEHLLKSSMTDLRKLLTETSLLEKSLFPNLTHLTTT